MPSRRRGPGRPFPKGHRPTGHRPKGRKDNRTIVREVLLGKRETLDLFARGDAKLKLKPRHERISDIIQKAPYAVAAALERELMQHDWGRPKETVKLEGKLDVTAAVIEAFKKTRGKK